MSRGKKAASATARRANIIAQTAAELRSEITALQIKIGAQETARRAELARVNIEHLAEYDARVDGRIDAEMERRIAEGAEQRWRQREHDLRLKIARDVKGWLDGADVKAEIEAFPRLLGLFGISDREAEEIILRRRTGSEISLSEEMRMRRGHSAAEISRAKGLAKVRARTQ